MIIDELKEKALSIVDEDLRILDFSFALPYTYVLIGGKKGKALGVAMTLPEEIQVYKSSFEEISVESFIEKSNSLNIIERTLGIAAINAVSQYCIDLSGASEEDGSEIVFKTEGIRRVALIGNMPPLVKSMKERGYEVYVFERNPKIMDKETLSDALEYRLLPKMDALLISGSALINDTLDLILERSKKAKLRILVGPSAQALPEFFKETGITHIASMKVINIDKALLKLKLGSFRGFGEESKKYLIRV